MDDFRKHQKQVQFFVWDTRRSKRRSASAEDSRFHLKKDKRWARKQARHRLKDADLDPILEP